MDCQNCSILGDLMTSHLHGPIAAEIGKVTENFWRITSAHVELHTPYGDNHDGIREQSLQSPSGVRY